MQLIKPALQSQHMFVADQHFGQTMPNNVGRLRTVIAQLQHHVEQLPIAARFQRIGAGLRLTQGTSDSSLRGLKIGPGQRRNKL